MRQLVIDCATEACSVALFDNGMLIAGTLEMLGRGHAEKLVPMIADLPNKGMADQIAVNVGPGSFTGIRVGLAAAKALALAWGSRLFGYETHSLIAAMVRDGNAPDSCSDAPVDVVMTGGHGEWFLQTFDADGTPSGQILSLPPDLACQKSHATCLAGTQAEALRSMRGNGRALSIWPDARSFPLLPQSALIEDPAPFYGRAPDAKLPTRA